MIILGISAFYHDSAAALIKDGRLIAAASEERFTRIKHDPDFPKHAIDFVLREAGIAVKDIDYIGFYDKPFVKFERLMFTFLYYFPRGLRAFTEAIPHWIKRQLFIAPIIREELKYKGPIYFNDHHFSHAASAFLVSPFKEAAIMTIDGVGEWSTATTGFGSDREITLDHEIRFPHSLGLLYSAFTYYLGFKVNSGEYKVMGLAPYGQPKYYDQVRELIDIRDDGSFKLNMKYFSYPYDLIMINKHFEDLMGGPHYPKEQKPTEHQVDVAASVQKVTDEIMVKMAQTQWDKHQCKNLCLAGGVALNCVANGHILRETPFENLFIQPAAGDAGGAIGAAYTIYNCILGNDRNFVMDNAYWGPGFSEEEMERALTERGAVFRRVEREELCRETARLIDEGNVVGWFQGRMEFGPRALGNRSILGDARDPAMKDKINKAIKFREAFRPFAPTVLRERTWDYFELPEGHDSPYMLLVAQVREDMRHIPSVTHVDGSARIQSVDRETNPLYYDVIKAFEERTGCPVIINTSFNVRGEPIVCDPDHAYVCFMRTHMDFLVVGPFLMDKKDQPELVEATDWRKQFVLD